MPNRTPYEIRHNLLVDARQMLFRVWERECDVIVRNADLGDAPIEDRTLPEAPTFEKILELATQMDDFVSNGPKREEASGATA